MTFADRLTVALLDCRDGRIAWANPALAGLVGAPDAGRLAGRSPDDWLADAGDGLPDWSAGELRPGAARPVECRLRAEDGAVRRVRVVPLGDGRWEVHDLTDLRRLGEEVRELAARLREARRLLADRTARGARERAMQEELLTRVSHELRTPVTVIAGFLRLLLGEEAGPLTAAQRRFLAECQRSVRRLDAFVANLVEAGGDGDPEAAAPALRDASLAATIESVAAFLKPLLEEGGQRLELALAHDAVRARFDPSRVEQVLVNLIGNALVHGGRGGAVTVTTRRLAAAGHAAVEVAVCDEGPGFGAADRERLFEPYVRGDAPGGGDAGAGVGLGLAICRSLVASQGGTIVAGDAPGGGARVAFTLPAAQGEAAG